MKQKINGVGKVLAGIILLTTLSLNLVFASNYNESTNTITAIEENGSYDFSGDSGEKFVNDNDTNLVIYGSTIDDIRGALVAIYNYISNDTNVGTGEIIAKLANISSLELKIGGNAEIIPNDLGYVKFLKDYVGNTKDLTIDVNVSSNVTFGNGTDDYNSETIASVATDKFTLSASGVITLPNGSDINAFFGSAKIENDNSLEVDEIVYKSSSNGFEVQNVQDSGKATITLNGIGTEYNLSSTGSLILNFTGSVTDVGGVGSLTGVTSIKITNSSGSLDGVKLWNTAFLDEELLKGSGEYIGNGAHQEFKINDFSATETGFKAEFSQTGTYQYEVSIVSPNDSSVKLSQVSSGSIVVNSPTLAGLNITGLNSTLTLTSSGTVENTFSVNIVPNDVLGEEVFTKVKVTGQNLDKVKLWNTAFPSEELLKGNGEYVGSADSEKYLVSATGANYKVEFGAVGTYNYEISLVSTSDTGVLVSETKTGSIVVEGLNLATLELSGIGTEYNLPSTGSLVLNFTGSISNTGSVGSLTGVTSIKITNSSGSLNGVKLWNTAFLDEELLKGNGEYIGSGAHQEFKIDDLSVAETGFKAEFSQTGTYQYEISIVSASDIGTLLSKTKTGSIIINPAGSPTLAGLNITGLNSTLTLPSGGIVENTFSVNIVPNGVGGEEVFTKVKVTGQNLDKVKLWNTAFPNEELLKGNGEYVGSADSEKYLVSATGANYKVEFGAVGTYNYEISLVSTSNTGVLVSEVKTGTVTVNAQYIPPVTPPYVSSGGGGATNFNGPKSSTYSGSSVAESSDKSQRIEVSYPAGIRTLTNTYNQTFDDASIMSDGTYRYMYHTLSGYIQEIPFNYSVSVKITDKKLNKNSKIYVKNAENQDWRELTNYELEDNTVKFTTDKGFIVRIINVGAEEELFLPVNQSIIETEYEENINENTSSTTGSEINNNNNNNTSESKIPALYILEEYYVNRKIIPGNGDEHFVEANEFLKNLDDLSLIGKVEYLSDYLPKLKLEIDNETDAVKKERLKLIYVLSGKVYKVYYNRLSNILAGKF